MPITQVLVVIAKVLAAAGFVGGLVLFARWAFPRSAARMEGTTATYTGAFTTSGWTGSWGTVLLEMADTRVAVRGRGPFRPFVRWESGYADISQAQAVRRVGMGGVLLRASCGSVAFWTPRWAEILDLLELRSVPVTRNEAKISMKDLA